MHDWYKPEPRRQPPNEPQWGTLLAGCLLVFLFVGSIVYGLLRAAGAL